MTIKVKYIESNDSLGTQDNINYNVYPIVEPEPDFTEKH